MTKFELLLLRLEVVDVLGLNEGYSLLSFGSTRGALLMFDEAISHLSFFIPE
jgi:hypothetical protein